MKARELREKFIKFFKKRDHQEIPNFSLVPEDDSPGSKMDWTEINI